MAPDAVLNAIVCDPLRAAEGLGTLHVADIAAAQAELVARGIDLQYGDTASTKVEFGQVQNPEGNAETLVEDLRGFDPAASSLIASGICARWTPFAGSRSHDRLIAAEGVTTIDPAAPRAVT